MILIIDNYDSFVHNLARYFTELGCETRVVRNDGISIAEVERQKPAAIVISPGPCTPGEAGVSVEIVRHFSERVPILGVCLGHQVIGGAFGAHVVRAEEPVHGRTSMIVHDRSPLFQGFPGRFRATRYHSLVVQERSLPKELRVIARTTEGLLMAVQHVTFPTFGVQFYPESVLTEAGHRLLANFLTIAGIEARVPDVGDYAGQSENPGWNDPELPTPGPLHW